MQHDDQKSIELFRAVDVKELEEARDLRGYSFILALIKASYGFGKPSA